MTITSVGTGSTFGVNAVGHWVRAFVSTFKRPANSNGVSSGEFAERKDVPVETRALLPIGPSCC